MSEVGKDNWKWKTLLNKTYFVRGFKDPAINLEILSEESCITNFVSSM